MGEWEGPQGLMASVIYIYIYTMVDNLTGGAIDGGGGQRGSQYNRQRNQQHGDK